MFTSAFEVTKRGEESSIAVAGEVESDAEAA
jgi:hypothetical protein